MQNYQIDIFAGIDQSTAQNRLSASFSPDAQNIDTENGDLAVAKGYAKHINSPVPGDGAIHRMYLWHTLDGDKFVVIAGNSVYWYKDGWNTVYTYNEPITSPHWDFEETRIGSVDYLIIANGQTQMIKWDGINSAEPFGSGAYVYESTIASVVYNMEKATSVTEATADNVLTYTLTMPSGWVFSEGVEIAFTVPTDIGEDVKTIKLDVDGNTHTLDFVPAWLAGDVARVKLVSATQAEYSLTAYGISTVVLNAAIPDEWYIRTLDIGLQLNDVTELVSDINGTTATLLEPTTRELKAGDTAKVRGGISDHPVNFIEMHYSRLFSAGDPNYPSRLYWSQPPSDTRSIEDWSMDEFSDITSGGHVEVGNTSSDPIVGLCSLSSQLIIFKQSSIYRLLGDRPTNYRVVQVNLDVERMVNSARVSYSDVPYWMTKAGMYYHDGQSAKLSPNARQVRDIVSNADLSRCKAAENRDKLYFTMKRGTGEYDDTIVEYDMVNRTYMLRNGFNVVDIVAYNGSMYLINDERYVYKWGEGDTYDGKPIEAYWTTPWTDLSAKSISKALKTLYIRGEGDIIIVETSIGKSVIQHRYLMPEDETDVLAIPLQNQAKVLRVKLMNEAGSYFKLMGGIEMQYEVKGD